MQDGWEKETSAERLLYDDAEPRLLRPVQSTVLKLRRPALLFFPLTLIIAALVPGILGAALLRGIVPGQIEVVAGSLGTFFLVVLGFAVLLARREGGSFALLMPSTLSVTHFLLMLGLAAAMFGSPMLQGTAFPAILGSVPGPQLDEPHLMVFKAYCFFFVVLTLMAVLSVFILRITGFQRVVADAA
ncbi:hypothetical protein [Parvularcula lutaonensis]|nr:hypothetical protein [Parvularcula lutaonensis]